MNGASALKKMNIFKATMEKGTAFFCDEVVADGRDDIWTIYTCKTR